MAGTEQVTPGVGVTVGGRVGNVSWRRGGAGVLVTVGVALGTLLSCAWVAVGPGLGDAVAVGLAAAAVGDGGAVVAVGGGWLGAQAVSPSSSRPANQLSQRQTSNGKGIGHCLERDIVPELGVTMTTVELFVLVGDVQFKEAFGKNSGAQMEGVLVVIATIDEQ